MGSAGYLTVSITSARNFIEKSGCGWIVAIGLAIVFVFSLVYTNMADTQARQEDQKPIPIATVGSQIVSWQSVEARFRQAASRLLNLEGGAPPEREAEVYAEALDIELRAAAQREIARKRGVQVSKQRVLDDAAKVFDSELAYRRAMLAATGQIKQNATEAEAQEALARMYGKDVALVRKEMLEATEKRLEDPQGKIELENQSLGNVLIEAASGSVQLSEDQLKKDLQTVVTKRIAFDLMKHPNEDLRAKAQKVLDEIKSGSISFEAAMNKYSDDPPPSDKKPKSESTVNLDNATIAYDESYAPLRTMKPGEVSPVLSIYSGPAIVKIVRLDPKLPADYATSKEERRKNRIRQIAVKSIQKEIEELVTAPSLKWTSPGFEVLYEWLKAYRDNALAADKSKLASRMLEIASKAEKVVTEGDSEGNHAASLAFFVATDKASQLASGDKKKQLEEQWLRAANTVLETTENMDLRIRLARMLLAKKDYKNAASSLTFAAQGNAGFSDEAIRRFKEIEGLRAQLASAGQKPKELAAAQAQWKSEAFEALKSQAELNEDYSETGRVTYADVNKRLAQLRSAGIINAAQAAEIEKFQARWRTEKVKADEEMARERKKAAEDAKKAAEEAKKNANKPSTPPSAPPSLNPLGTTGSATTGG